MVHQVISILFSACTHFKFVGLINIDRNFKQLHCRQKADMLVVTAVLEASSFTQAPQTQSMPFLSGGQQTQ